MLLGFVYLVANTIWDRMASGPEKPERVAETAAVDLLDGEGLHPVDRVDDLLADDRSRLEIEVTQEVDRPHLERERVRLREAARPRSASR